MNKLTLISLFTALSLSTSSAESMFSMSRMMDKMTDAAKTIKTEVTDAVGDIKDKVTDTIDEVKDAKDETETKNVEVTKHINRPKDAPVTESIDLTKE